MQQSRISAPYGDIYLVNTPQLDRTALLLQQEQKQKELVRKKEESDLDKEFSKNISNIRPADVNEFMQKYGEFKNKWMSAKKGKGVISPEQQRELMMSRGQLYDFMSKSQQENDYEKEKGKDLVKNYKKYKTDAPKQLRDRMGKPLSLLTDKDSLDNLNYDGIGTDFTPLLSKSIGKLVDTEPDVSEVKGSTFKTYIPFKRINNAKEQYQTLISGVHGSDQYNDFIRLSNPSESEYETIKNRYDEIMKDPIMAKKWGLPAGDTFKSYNDATDLERGAAFIAMNNTIQHPPIAGIPKNVSNPDKAMEKRNELSLGRMLVQHGYNIDMLNRREAFKKASLDEVVGAAQEAYNDQVNNSTIIPFGGDGKEKNMPVSPVIKNAFSKKDENGKSISPSKFVLLPNGSVRLEGEGFDEVLPATEYIRTLGSNIYNSKGKVAQLPHPSKKVNTHTENKSPVSKKRKLY